MKWLFLFILAMIVGGLSSISGKIERLEKDFSSQKILQAYLEARSELCAKKAANYAYVLDKKFYSEEGAQRIYRDCLVNVQ